MSHARLLAPPPLAAGRQERTVSSPPALLTGIVTEEGSPHCQITLGDRLCTAMLAASCLMQPEKGDTVILARLDHNRETDDLVVLAVLARADNSRPCRLRLPENSRFETAGNLELLAMNSLSLHGGQAMDMQTENLTLTAAQGHVRMTRLETVADTVRTWCRSLHSMGVQAQTVFHSLTQCLKISRRIVENEDETRAGKSTLIVSETVAVQAKNTITLAQDVARTDAGQIQLG